MAALKWNEWQLSSGLGGSFALEYATLIGFAGKTAFALGSNTSTLTTLNLDGVVNGAAVRRSNNTVDDYADEASDSSAPIGMLSVGSALSVYIGPADSDDTFGDKDVFKVSLTQGQSYQIQMQSQEINGQTLHQSIFTIRDPNNFDSVLSTSAIGANVSVNFTANSTGDYYIRVGTGGAATDQGGYQLSATQLDQTVKLLPDSLLLEFFARQVAYGYEPLLAKNGQTLPVGHFAAGWTLETEFDAAGGLFRAVALTKPGFDSVLAFRGTETNISDWMQNTTPSGVGAEEFEAAWADPKLKQWLMDHPNASITGHSQGGAQAQMLAYRAAENAIGLGQLVTFNSAGTNKINTDLSSTLSFSDVTHFISAGDIVSQVGVQFVPGKIVYYDLNFQETDRLGYLPLAYAAHTGHWAQDGLYSSKFLRTENIPESQSVRISSLGPTYEDLIKTTFSHLIAYSNVDNEYFLFKTQFLKLLEGNQSLENFLGFGVSRADEILSSRAGSESARINEMPRLLELVNNIIVVADHLWVTGDEAVDFSCKILSKSAELGYKTLDASLDFSLLVLKKAADIGLISIDLVFDFINRFHYLS